MPVVLRSHGYKFWFYMADVSEPPHIHVGKDGNEAKFWLKPVKIAREGGFRPVALREIERIINENLEFLLAIWEEEKGKYAHS
ncbi:MAG: hypothetical protein Fur002_21480 [Anaerolineales bacterium]